MLTKLNDTNLRERNTSMKWTTDILPMILKEIIKMDFAYWISVRELQPRSECPSNSCNLHTTDILCRSARKMCEKCTPQWGEVAEDSSQKSCFNS